MVFDFISGFVSKWSLSKGGERRLLVDIDRVTKLVTDEGFVVLGKVLVGGGRVRVTIEHSSCGSVDDGLGHEDRFGERWVAGVRAARRRARHRCHCAEEMGV